MKRILISLVAAAMVYPAFAFISAEVNPFEWEEFGRFLMILVSIWIFGVCMMFQD